MKRGFQRILICILLVSLLNLNGLGDLCIIHASANVASGNMNELGNGINSGSFSQNEVKIDFVLNGSWDSGHNVTVIIQNLSETNTIENWQLVFDYPVSISNVWNASITDYENEQYVVKNCGWNKDIGVEESVTFGFSCNGSFGGFPNECDLLEGNRDRLEFDSFQVTISNSWDNGFTGTIIINNTSDQKIEDWIVEFDCSGVVESVWDGQIVEKHENHYVVKNAGYNYAIEAGSFGAFGFLVSGASSEDCISNLALMADRDEGDIKQGASLDVENDPEIGTIYRKAFDEEDICYDEATGTQYLENQLLISAFPGVERQIIEMMASDIQAEVVGYIELTNDYQLEFTEDKTLEELNVLSEYCMGLPYVSYCSPNYCYGITANDNTVWEDALYNDNLRAWQRGNTGNTNYYGETVPNEDEASLACLTGDNWGLKALNVPAAWGKVDASDPVKVGIYDHGFASYHEDLSFEKQYNNDQYTDDGSHGTHVAGIIGAKHNNLGIAGVSQNVELFSYTFVGDDQDSFDALGEKIAFASLIGNHVKIINYSQGSKAELVYAASKGNESAQRTIANAGRIMEEFLLKVYGLGYDFLIVTSAGNTNDKKFVETKNSSKYPYGYMKVKEDDASGIKDIQTLAIYNSALNSISNPIVRGRIITVGSIDHQYHNNVHDGYNVHKCSNAGDRVDVFAPGAGILSTVPTDFPETDIKGYALMSGTSQAAPYVSGIAALMFQANPQIGAREVKKIICDSNNQIDAFEDGLGFVHPMPDAEVCVMKAIESPGMNQAQNERYNGIIAGLVTDLDGAGIKDMTVCVMHAGMDIESDASVFCFKTSTDGTYTCSVPNGTYDVLIYKAGLVPCRIYGVKVKAEEVTQLEKIYVAGLDLDTYSEKLARGKVTYYSGKGVPNVRVRLRPGWNNTTGAYVRDKSGNIIQATTDYNGDFSFYVPRGIYTTEFFRSDQDFKTRNVILMK